MNVEHRIKNAIMTYRKTGDPLIVAVCGGADLGKSYVSKSLVDVLRQSGVPSNHVTLDSFMMNREERIAKGLSGYQPEAYDFDAIEKELICFGKRECLTVFPYDHSMGKRAKEPQRISPGDILILDGLHSMNRALTPYTELSLFIYTDDDLLRNIRREADRVKRMQSPDISEKYEPVEFAKYKKYVEPYREQATWRVFLEKKWEYVFLEKPTWI